MNDEKQNCQKRRSDHSDVEVFSRLTGERIGAFAPVDENHLDALCEKVSRAFNAACATLPKEREVLLKEIINALSRKSQSLIDLLMHEIGKPFSLAKLEVDTAFQSRDSILSTAASEALRNGSSVEPMFVPVGSLQRMCLTRRFPTGPVLSSIEAWSPLSFLAHELGACIAAGTTMLVRISESCALTGQTFDEIVREAIGDISRFAVVPMSDNLFAKALTSEFFKIHSIFRGRNLQDIPVERNSGARMLVRDFGGASAIVTSDCDLKRAADLTAQGAFANAGRMDHTIKAAYIHSDSYDTFRELLIERTKELISGIDPFDKNTLYSARVDDTAEKKAKDWIAAQISLGKVVVDASGNRDCQVAPVILEAVSIASEASIPMDYPVLLLLKYNELDDAVKALSLTKMNSLVVLFSREQEDGLRALETGEFGTLVMNEYSFEMEPGVLYRSLREGDTGNYGIRFAIEDFTEKRAMLFNNWWGG